MNSTTPAEPSLGADHSTSAKRGDSEEPRDHSLDSTSSHVSRPRKRTKIANACEACRARKSKCDGTRPVCGPCQRRSHRPDSVCIYSKPASGDSISEPITTQSLIDRIHSLERMIASTGPESNEKTAGPGSDSYVLPSLSGHTYLSHDNRQTRLTPTRIEHETSPVNAMGSTAYLNSRGTSPLDAAGEFYGGSSAAHFLKQIKEAVLDTGPANRTTLQSMTENLPSKINEPRPLSSDQGTFHLEHLTLPHRDVADRLMEVYWNKSHTLYPFIDKALFMSSYEDLWKPSTKARTETRQLDLGLGTAQISGSRTSIFHCALNAIFALSCQLSDTNILDLDRGSISKDFFQRSKNLLHVDIFDHGSIAIVQTLLIMAQFLQSTSSPSRCWTSLGLACRIGQGLGLHVEDQNSRRNSKEIEIRRCVWYGCTMMDIVASTTLGRPTMIPPQPTIPFPSTPPQVNLIDTNCSISRSAFYLESIKLYLILGKILSTVYRPWLSQSGNENLTNKTKDIEIRNGDTEVIMSLDEELSCFEDEIIPYLHWEKGKNIRSTVSQPRQQIIQMQTNVLHARYLHIRVLLYRPAFWSFCKKMSTSHLSHETADPSVIADHSLPRSRSLRSQMGMQSATACVGAAIELVNLLFEATSKAEGGAWWYTTFYVSTAAIIVVLAESCLSHGSIQVEKNEILTAWELCCQTLRILVKRGHPVEPTLSGLCNMRRKVTSGKSSTKSQDRPAMTYTAENIQADRSQVTQDMAFPNLIPDFDGLDQQASEHANEAFTSATQPMMDFMMQDVNFMPFGVLDESWWHLQYGDTTTPSF